MFGCQGMWMLMHYVFFLYCFGRARVCWPLLCLYRSFCIFERCLDLKPRELQYMQSGALTQPPIFLLSHPSPYLATHLLTQPPISLLSPLYPYLASHLPTQAPISLLSHPYPYTNQRFRISGCNPIRSSVLLEVQNQILIPIRGLTPLEVQCRQRFIETPPKLYRMYMQNQKLGSKRR